MYSEFRYTLKFRSSSIFARIFRKFYVLISFFICVSIDKKIFSTLRINLACIWNEHISHIKTFYKYRRTRFSRKFLFWWVMFYIWWAEFSSFDMSEYLVIRKNFSLCILLHTFATSSKQRCWSNTCLFYVYKICSCNYVYI